MGFQNRVTAKRSLGQNFLVNSGVIEKITTIVIDSKPKHITEIGPGKGAFTKVFYGTTIPLTLIEKDNNLFQLLQNNYKNIELYNLDFLDYKTSNFETTYFGSLPFNVSKEIIDKILKSETFKNPAFFIIQKEVAEKYLNRNKNELGFTREIYADFKILFDIKPGSFNPKPKVTSSFVKFIPNNHLGSINKQDLEILIQRSFKMPRKTLKNNLSTYGYKIPENINNERATELELDDYVSILQHS
ncbi:MAG: rRNA adenine dimethyltransferase family protein [Candidatus Dojkabacteria bacterium]|nr:rRNA adenine dimethyltransferase family protein [Candidatus Dojkabacteria bacterium]